MEIHWAEENVEFAFFTLNCKLNYYINLALFFVIPLLLSYLNLYLFLTTRMAEFLYAYSIASEIAKFIEHTPTLYQFHISLNQIYIFQLQGK